MAKLPSGSHAWYYRFHHELARHMYVSYCNSIMSHLPLLHISHFGSEEELSVLIFYNMSYYCHP